MVQQQTCPSGISAAGEVPWGTHFCQFYHTREDLIDTLVPYFKAGLENNEYCLWITSEPLPAAEARNLLARAVPDFEEHLHRRQIEICDVSDWYVPGARFDAAAVLNGWLERERRALERGFTGLRLTGNTFWLERVLWDNFMAYEDRVTGAFARRRVLALCTYCLEKCTARDVLDVVARHQFALTRRLGSWELIESSALKVAKEELQRLNERLEQRVRERTRELEGALRGRDELLAMLAHELRNPMAPILNGLHVLQMANDDEARAQALEMMGRQIRHLSQVVEDLLDVSRITRGQARLRPERLDLARLARTTAEGHRARMQKAGLTLALDLPETPVWVRGDAARLTQVLDNLLDNARKFSHSGGRVEVALAADRDGSRAVLTVRDTGAGIDRAVLPRLFEVFTQAEQGIDRPRGGLGLGLSVVKGLVELHGGTVEAASAGSGRGATFTVRLPLEPEPEALAGQSAAAHPEGRRLRVLVIEDNPDAARSLRLLLGLMGHEVRVAHSGPDGVKASAEWHPDAVISDIGLPGLNGYDVARRVRKQPGMARALLIALTGYGQEEDRRLSAEAGFAHHLVKPADPDGLEQILADWAATRSSE